MHTLQHDDLLLLGTIQGDLSADHEEDQGDGQGVEDDFDGEEDGVVCDVGQCAEVDVSMLMVGLTEIVLVGDDVTDELEFASSGTMALGGTVADSTTHF